MCVPRNPAFLQWKTGTQCEEEHKGTCLLQEKRNRNTRQKMKRTNNGNFTFGKNSGS